MQITNKFWLWISESRGLILTPPSKDLNLKNDEKIKRWFESNKPIVLILAA